MVEIPRAPSTGRLTTQTTAPEIRDITSFTKTSEALKQFGGKLTDIGLVFKEREKDRESTLAKIEYQKFQAEVKEFYADPNNLNSNSRKEAIDKLNKKRKELMGTISREGDRDEFILSTGSSMFQTGAIISNAARTQIQKNQKSAFIEFKEGKIAEFLETPITNDLKAASTITELEVERGKLDANGYLSDAERTSATGNFSIEGIKNEVIQKKIDHDMSTDLLQTRDNLVNGRYGLGETANKDQLKKVDSLIKKQFNEARIEILFRQDNGSLEVNDKLDTGQIDIAGISKMVEEGNLEQEEGELYKQIFVGLNTTAIPTEQATRDTKDDLDVEFFNLFIAPLSPEERGKPLQIKDIKSATKKTALEKLQKYRKNLQRARLNRHLSKSEFDNRMGEIGFVRLFLIDEKVNSIAGQIYKREKAVLKEMSKWVDRFIPGDQTDFRERTKELLRERMKEGFVSDLLESGGKKLKKGASADIINEVWRREQERVVREISPQFNNVKDLPNASFDGQGEKIISLNVSEAKTTRRVSQKEVKKSNSATEKMIRAINKEGFVKGLEELRDNPERAEQLGVDVDAVLNRFKQER